MCSNNQEMSARRLSGDKFYLGQIKLRPEVVRSSTELEIQELLNRHASCDWGEVGETTRTSNAHSVRLGGQIISRHTAVNGITYLVITTTSISTTVVSIL